MMLLILYVIINYFIIPLNDLASAIVFAIALLPFGRASTKYLRLLFFTLTNIYPRIIWHPLQAKEMLVQYKLYFPPRIGYDNVRDWHRLARGDVRVNVSYFESE